MKLIAYKEREDSLDVCDIYRKNEWSKYSEHYHNLLNTTPVSKTLDIQGLLHLDGEMYTSRTNCSYDIFLAVKESLVKRPKLIWLPCIDERIQYLTASHHALSLGVPGCECLMSAEEKVGMADELIRICEENPTIEEIVVTSHSQCGAVEHAHSHHKQPRIKTVVERFRDHTKVIDAESKQYASNFKDILEQRIREKGRAVRVRTHHFGSQELHSRELHHAFGTIVNFNPLLNAAELEENLELPMFNIYAGGQQVSQIVENIELAIRVASSSSGFSCEYINKDNPFIVFFTLPHNDSVSAGVIRKVIENIQQKSYPLDLVYSAIDS